jgi:hypothetical protein
MLALVPVFVIADMVLILLLQLLAIQMEVFAQLRATNRIGINTNLLKNQRTLWSSEFPVALHSSLC